MFKPVGKGAFIFYLRMWALPMALTAIYLLQQEFPSIHRHCALWSERMQWWQFFTCSFLSHDLGHLAVNAGGLAIVYSQFAPQVRGPVLAVAFCLFATLSNLVFFEWLMPRPAWLIGASGGSYPKFLIAFRNSLKIKDRPSGGTTKLLRMPPRFEWAYTPFSSRFRERCRCGLVRRRGCWVCGW